MWKKLSGIRADTLSTIEGEHDGDDITFIEWGIKVGY
jgi:hypothetical protein